MQSCPTSQMEAICSAVLDSGSNGPSKLSGLEMVYAPLECLHEEVGIDIKASSSSRADVRDLQFSSCNQHSHGYSKQQASTSFVDDKLHQKIISFHDECQQKLVTNELTSAGHSERREGDYVIEYSIPNGWDDHTEADLEEFVMKSLDSIYKEAANKIMMLGHSAEQTLWALLKNGRLYGSKDAISNVVENATAVMPMIDQDPNKNSCGFSNLRDVQRFSLREILNVLKAARSSLTNGDAMWCLLVCDMNLAHACAIEQAPLLSLQRNELPSSESWNTPQQSNRRLSSPVRLQSNTSTSSCSAESNSAQLQLGLASSVASLPTLASTEALTPIVAVTELEQQGHSNSCNLSAVMVESTISHPLLSDELEDDCILTMAQPYQKQSGASPCQENVKSPAKKGAGVGSWNASGENGVAVDPASFGLRLSVPLDVHARCKRPEMSFSACDTAESNADQGKSFQSLFSGSKLIHPISRSEMRELHAEVLNETQASKLSELCSSKEETEDVSTGVCAAGTELSLSLSSVASDVSVKLDEGPSVNLEETRGTESKMNESNAVSTIFQKRAFKKQDRALRMLLQRIKDLESQLRERTEWAQEKVVQAARRLSKDLTELKTLRAERDEALRLKVEKQTLEESTMKKLSEMDNALCKASSQVDRANAAIRRLEMENAEVRAEMEAAKLNASESVATCEEVVKREKKSAKKAQACEKQKAKLQEELSAERRKIVQLQQQLAQGKEQRQQSEVRWRQEEKAKEDAVLLLEFEKRSREQTEAGAKKREEAIRRKAEANAQRQRDDIERLERRISLLRFSSESLPRTPEWRPNPTQAPSTTEPSSVHGLKEMNARLIQELADFQEFSQRDVHRDRECVMCMNEEMSVVLLPCAHQVLCPKCNDLHEKQGMTDCPSCRTRIQRRIRVFGVSS